MPIENILPALEYLDGDQPAEALMQPGVEANVRHTVRQLLETPEAKAKLSGSNMMLVGAIYDIETGQVRFLDS